MDCAFTSISLPNLSEGAFPLQRVVLSTKKLNVYQLFGDVHGNTGIVGLTILYL